MTDEEIRASIRETMVPAEGIWGANSPFAPNSNWVGYVSTKEQADYLDRTFGNSKQNYSPKSARYGAIRDALRDMLPTAGRDYFDAGGFGRRKIYLNMQSIGWTPSGLAYAMAIDPKTGEPFTLGSGWCG